MYYCSGNYEAFARPRKPQGVENKTAWFVASGLAALAGGAFLIRDGQMPGNQITILEQQELPGGALDGLKEPEKGFVIRGGREMEEHFECLWDLYITRIQQACAAAGKVAGIWCGSAEMARDMLGQGLQLVVPGHDAIWLKAEIARRLAVIHEVSREA